MTSTSNDADTDVATQTRQATEKAVEVFKNSVTTFTDQLDQFQLPTVDLTEPVARYFEYVQQAVELNRDLVIKWAELVTGILKDQTNTVAELATRQAEKAEQVAKELADKVEQIKREQAEEAEEAEKAQAREAKRIEREEAKKAQEKAHEAYEGLTKAELSDQLEARGLPKTGNLEDLIERLVSADTE
ncbi:MAG TPA: SAP domain-containing protein [Mycobacterium sp.]